MKFDTQEKLFILGISTVKGHPMNLKLTNEG